MRKNPHKSAVKRSGLLKTNFWYDYDDEINASVTENVYENSASLTEIETGEIQGIIQTLN